MHRQDLLISHLLQTSWELLRALHTYFFKERSNEYHSRRIVFTFFHFFCWKGRPQRGHHTNFRSWPGTAPGTQKCSKPTFFNAFLAERLVSKGNTQTFYRFIVCYLLLSVYRFHRFNGFHRLIGLSAYRSLSVYRFYRFVGLYLLIGSKTFPSIPRPYNV